MSKDIQFHETNPFFSKLPETTSHEDCVLDFFPLPRMELSISSKSKNYKETVQSEETLHTNDNCYGMNTDGVAAGMNTNGDSCGMNTDGVAVGINTNGDSHVKPQDVFQELNENEPTVAAPRRNPINLSTQS